MLKHVRSRQELYRSFLEFISNDVQNERRLINRRMLSVFIWCFFLPVVISLGALFLVKVNLLPRYIRYHVDWLILIIPISYSLYFLGSEVLSQVPSAVRKGGLALSLGQPLKESTWRDRVIDSMEQKLDASSEEWDWITSNFKLDLESMHYRVKYLTILSGAVFYLLMHGIDAITDTDATLVKTPLNGWIETASTDSGQYVGLALFLILFYLSGSQTTQSLYRYLGCAQWIARHTGKK